MDISLLNGLTNPEFSLGGVKFQIIKLSPMSGFNLSEKIRFALASSADAVDIGDNAINNDKDGQNQLELAAAVLFCKAVLKLHPATIEEFRNTLFESVEFSGGDISQGWMKLKGMEDMAFKNPFHIYEVLVRSLVVNFTGSFKELMQKFPAAMQDLMQ